MISEASPRYLSWKGYNSVVRQIPSNPSQYLLRNFSKSSSRAKLRWGGHCLCGYNVSLLVLSDISSFFQIINSWFVMVCLSASVTRKTLFHTRRFLLNFEETRETFEKFPFSPQLWWLSPNWQFSIQLYSGKLWIFTKCHLNWHFLTFKRSLVENSGNSSLESFWCHLICLQNLNLKWEIFCDNIW